MLCELTCRFLLCFCFRRRSSMTVSLNFGPLKLFRKIIAFLRLININLQLLFSDTYCSTVCESNLTKLYVKRTFVLDLFSVRRRHLRRQSDSAGVDGEISCSDSSTNALAMKTNTATRTILLTCKPLRFASIGMSEGFGCNKNGNSSAINLEHFVSSGTYLKEKTSLLHSVLDYAWCKFRRRDLFVQSDGANLYGDHLQRLFSDASLLKNSHVRSD